MTEPAHSTRPDPPYSPLGARFAAAVQEVAELRNPVVTFDVFRPYEAEDEQVWDDDDYWDDPNRKQKYGIVGRVHVDEMTIRDESAVRERLFSELATSISLALRPEGNPVAHEDFAGIVGKADPNVDIDKETNQIRFELLYEL